MVIVVDMPTRQNPLLYLIVSLIAVVGLLCVGLICDSRDLLGQARAAALSSVRVAQHLQEAHAENWSNNELDTEDTSLGSLSLVNQTREIQSVISDQRLIAKKMEGYNYPNGQHNITAK